jgi:hypothetical protein
MTKLLFKYNPPVLLVVFLAAWAVHQAGLSMALDAIIMAMAVIPLSMLVTPRLVRVGDSLAKRTEGKRDQFEDLPNDVLDSSQRQAFIGGYGRMDHTIAALLLASGIHFVVLDKTLNE